MKIAPDLSNPLAIVKDTLEVEALTGVKSVKPVHARTLPPPVVQSHSQREGEPDITDQQDRRHEPHIDGERRTYCRRIEHLPVLIDLRSEIDRRRHNQREGDIVEHIDVEV